MVNTFAVFLIGSKPSSTVFYGEPWRNIPVTPNTERNHTIGEKRVYGKVIVSTEEIDIYTCKKKGKKGHYIVRLEEENTISFYCGTKYEVGDRIVIDTFEEGI